MERILLRGRRATMKITGISARPGCLVLLGLLALGHASPARAISDGDARRARQARELFWSTPLGHALDPNDPSPGKVGGKLVPSGFASLGLVLGPVDGTGRLRDGDRDGPFAEIRQVALLLDGRPGLRTRFHLQLDALSEREGPGGPRLSEAWIFRRRIWGKLSARIGAFPPPFSLEHNGPGRSTDMTITPSALNGYFEGIRLTGVEWRKTPEPVPNHLSWQAAWGQARNDASPTRRPFSLDDRTAAVDRTPGESRRAGYFYLGKKHSDSCRSGRWGWHAGFFDLDDDGGGEASTRLALLSIDYFLPRIGFIFQACDGSVQDGGGPPEDLRCFYLLAHGRLKKRLSATFRVDGWNRSLESGAGIDRGHAWTLALNRSLARKALLQLEWLRCEGLGGLDDGERMQLRYRLSF